MSQDVGQRGTSRLVGLWRRSEGHVRLCYQAQHPERSYIRINEEVGILEHGGRKQHHLHEYEKIFKVVRDFLCYELHEVRH